MPGLRGKGAGVRTVWITGGGGGIGAALAKSYADDGWSVYISGRDARKLRRLADLSGAIQPHVCDITDVEAVKDCVEVIGPIDQAILNAGAYEPGSVAETPLAAFRSMMEVNYFGTISCVNALLPGMREKGGRIAVVGSLAGYRGLPNASGYGPSKAALIGYCESLRAELEGGKVVVQLINPGFVETALTAKNDFEMPYLTRPEEAARDIRRGLLRENFEIAFPAPLVRRLKIARILPYKWYFPLIRRMTKT